MTVSVFSEKSLAGEKTRAREISGNHDGGQFRAPVEGYTFCEADFEDGEIPDDWDVVETASENDTFPVNWFVATTDDSVAMGNGFFMAWVNYSESETQDEWIITPEMDFTDYSDSLYLDFLQVYHVPDPWADSATVYIRVSTDNGATWPDTIYSITTESEPGLAQVTLDLADLAPACVNSDSVKIGFEYSGRNGDSAGLDDIVVRAGAGTGIRNSSWGRIKSRFAQ